MPHHLPEIFADGLTQVSMANGVMRLTFGRQTGSAETENVGYLFIPLIQVPPTLQAIYSALDQLNTEQTAMTGPVVVQGTNNGSDSTR